MSLYTRIITHLRSLPSRIAAAFKSPVSTAAKDTSAITVRIAVNAEDALVAIESITARVREFKAEILDALETAEKFESKAAAWAATKAHDAVSDSIKLADHAVLDVTSVYADGERLAANVVDAITATAAKA